MSAGKLEDLECWQASRDLVSLVYGLAGKRKIDDGYGLKEKMQRAALSAYINIEEAFDGKSDKMTGKYLADSRNAIHELQSLLYVAVDLEVINFREFEKVKSRVSILQHLMAGFQFEYSDIY